MSTPLLPLLHTYIKTKYFKKFRSRDALEAWQKRQVRKHFAWLKTHCPYFRGVEATDWQDLPQMNKAKMMEAFDQLNTAGLSKERLFNIALGAEESRDFSETLDDYTVGLSSGTSGSRGLFVVSSEERANWAGYVLARMLPRSLLSTQRIALFLRAGGPLYQSTQSSRIQFKYFDLFQSLEGHLGPLENYQPTVLVAPPSVLRFLAQAKPTIRPEKIVSVAEVLGPLDREVIESAFALRLDEIYQATEGCLASTCSHGTLHLHEDLMLIEKEWVDEGSRRFVPVITDFRRRTQPIVRYRLDDVLIERKEHCPCGSVFTAIESIEGRCDDVLLFPAKCSQEHVRIFPDFIRRRIVGSSDAIKEYRVIQTADDTLEVQLEAPEKLRTATEAEVREALNSLFEAQGAQPPHIKCSPWQPQPAHQKLRRVHRRLEVED